MELNSFIERIASHSGKDVEEVKRLVEEKKEKFASMLSDNGAALMVARELGVDLEEKSFTESIEIKDLEPGMANVDLEVSVKQAFMPRSYERKGKQGEFVSLVVVDKSGEIRLSVWNNSVRDIAEGRIRKGDSIGLHNCYVSEYNEKLQLNLGFGGSLRALDKSVVNMGFSDKGVSQIVRGEELSDVDLVGKVLRVFPEREFTANTGEGERKGRLTNFIIADESGEMRATGWNDLGDYVRKLEGQVVRIESAYTKAGLNELNELHLGYRSRIFRTEGFKELESLGIRTIKEKKITELGEEDKNVVIEGVIIDIPRLPSLFHTCSKCNSKVIEFDGSFVCDKCGQTEPKQGLAGSVELDDGSSTIRCVAFRETAEKLLNSSTKEAKELLEDDDGLQKLRNKVVSSKVKLLGNARKSSFDDKIEFIVREVM